MKAFKIDIHPQLQGVEITVKNGALFTRCALEGKYKVFSVQVSEYDLPRLKKFAVKYGNDKSSNRGNWYAHCNGYAMDLLVTNAGKDVSINTYRPYGQIERTY